jgi:hypothetical protein
MKRVGAEALQHSLSHVTNDKPRAAANDMVPGHTSARGSSDRVAVLENVVDQLIKSLGERTSEVAIETSFLTK